MSEWWLKDLQVCKESTMATTDAILQITSHKHNELSHTETHTSFATIIQLPATDGNLRNLLQKEIENQKKMKDHKK